MIVKPVETNDVLSNPWMGWGLWAGPIFFNGTPRSLADNTVGFGADAPLYNWVLLDWMWADLEPQEGHFQWEALDAIIQYWAGRGKQINLRIWVTDDAGWDNAPGASMVCPDWVYAAGLRWHEYIGEGKTPKREPDYVDPSFQLVWMPRLKNMLEAVADRYDKPNHPFNFIGCMGYGQWGEWHTKWSNYYWPSKQVKHDILAKIVNLYADTFKHVDLAISYALDTFNIGTPVPPTNYSTEKFVAFSELIGRDDAEDFKYRQALDVAIARGFLLGRHGFIDRLQYIDRQIMEAEWLKRAFYAEGNWYYIDVKDQKTHGTFDENIDIMLEWHSNYGHFYTDAAAYRRSILEDTPALARGLQCGGLGYRLVLTEAAYPDPIAPGYLFLLRQKWVNRNVGRCYKRHPLRLYLLDSTNKTVFSETDQSFNQISWVRGQTYEHISIFHLPPDLPEGAYDLRIAMVSLDGTPTLSLAMADGDVEKRYRVGTVHIQREG